MAEEIKVEQETKRQPTVGLLTLYGDIDSTATKGIHAHFNKTYHDDPLILEIDSDGGDPAVTNHLIDMMNSRNVPILIIIANKCYSAAMGFLGLGKATRLCYSGTGFMQHSMSFKNVSGSHGSVKEYHDYALGTEGVFRGRLQTASGLSDAEITELFNETEIWFDSLDALMAGRLGMVDGIIFREVEDCEYIVLTREGFKHFEFPKDDITKLPVMTEEELVPYKLKPFVPDNVMKAFKRRNVK